jgi:hypothetical protein
MGLLGKQNRVQIIQNGNTVIQLDASIKESHSRESPPSEFPIENGEVISDHIIIKPFQLEITGIISDTPIGGLKGYLTEAATSVTSALLPPVALLGASAGVALLNANSKAKSPSVQAYLQLLQLQSNAKPVDVLTSLNRYANMWIKSISVPRDSDTGKALLFTVGFVQLLLVTPQSVNISIFANPGLSANQSDNGEQGTDLNSRFKAGLADGTTAVNNVTGGTVSGGTQ